MKISVIIPTLNEKEIILKLIHHLTTFSGDICDEVIVVDGGSNDHTAKLVNPLVTKVIELNSGRRSIQMNAGAKLAKNELLYFIHADSIPPKNFTNLIVEAVKEGYEAGCFRSKFDSKNAFLQFCSHCTRYKPIFCRGGGQSLYVTKKVFEKAGMYEEAHRIMEEYDLILRLKKLTKFRIIPHSVIVSARKYRKNGTYRLYLSYALIFILFFAGVRQQKLQSIYKKLIR